MASADSYDVVAGAPTFSLEWRFDTFAKDLFGARRTFNAWDGTVHFNLNRVAFETNLTNNPRICRTRPEVCLDSEPDGSLRRFSWPYRNESLGYASIDLSSLLTSRGFWSSKEHYTVELQKTKDGPSTKTERVHEEATSLGRLYLNVSWEGDDDYQFMGMGMGSLLRPIFAASTKLLHAAAKCIVDPLGEDPIAVPAHHHGKAWAARQYFMSTYSGPREGECSEHPVPLGWLDQMMEDGNLPRDLKVWRVDGGKAWVSLGQEIKAEIKAELKAEKKKAAEASTSV